MMNSREESAGAASASRIETQAPKTEAAGFDIAPFALPNCPPGEVRFEESRQIREVVVEFRGEAPQEIGLSYLHKYWPQRMANFPAMMDNPCFYGWVPIDDWFNSEWQKAAIEVKREGPSRLRLGFAPLGREFPDCSAPELCYRWTLGVRLDGISPEAIERVFVLTTARPTQSTLCVELDAGQATPGQQIALSGYNAQILQAQANAERLSPAPGEESLRLELPRSLSQRSFELTVAHMLPATPNANDDALMSFELSDGEMFTVSLSSLASEGPVWFAERGVYVRFAQDPVSFEEYTKRIEGSKTLAEQAVERPEQTLAGASFGQPRPHPVSYNLACKHARQRFWLEANGDVLLNKANVTRVSASDTPRYKNRESARFFFGLESWYAVARFCDPSPVPIYNIHLRQGALLLEQRSLAMPLLVSPLEQDALLGDSPTVALLRFRFKNTGDTPCQARLPICYSQDSRRSFNALTDAVQNEYLLPQSPLDQLDLEGNRLLSRFEGEQVLRCTIEGTMQAAAQDKQVLLTQALEPGQSCEALLKIPFLALESPEELKTLGALHFESADGQTTRFWRQEGRRGAQLSVPEIHLEELHRSHLMHVEVTDFVMPDDPELINTSVGTSTYGNFSNESCMVVHELDQRGLHEEARRRLELWIRYQGSVPQPGNFSDYEGMYFGAGGFEEGSYNQHHGWVLWCLCEHFFLTGDRGWMDKVSSSVLAAADWVFRQRRLTMQPLAHSRGWERGFLPAGSLEDVTDFHYWLSTNALTWRGTEWAARALQAISHPEAPRVRAEADAYRHDLIQGFETMRRHSPLVRLRSGRWVPHYPSRLYCRGRDTGWIRELLEGSIYLLLSGLYDANSREAGWILDDYQDNRYPCPPYGYQIEDFSRNWFDRAGFSIQPNLLAGLLPYLDRDEPELYLWMFFNAWAACYREEINALVEHPAPVLGYSNSAHFKTSDESNAMNWLRYMMVYVVQGRLLHFGRAIPRQWMKDRGAQLGGVATCFGKAGVRYLPALSEGKITAEVELDLERTPERILVRFRHPEKAPMRLALVNGQSAPFDAQKGDVDLTGQNGQVKVEAFF